MTPYRTKTENDYKEGYNSGYMGALKWNLEILEKELDMFEHPLIWDTEDIQKSIKRHVELLKEEYEDVKGVMKE